MPFFYVFTTMVNKKQMNNVVRKSSLPCFFIFSVSKTTKELILRWKNDLPVDISSEVKMPQFEIFKVNPARCEETFHIGTYDESCERTH